MNPDEPVTTAIMCERSERRTDEAAQGGGPARRRAIAARPLSRRSAVDLDFPGARALSSGG